MGASIATFTLLSVRFKTAEKLWRDVAASFCFFVLLFLDMFCATLLDDMKKYHIDNVRVKRLK